MGYWEDGEGGTVLLTLGNAYRIEIRPVDKKFQIHVNESPEGLPHSSLTSAKRAVLLGMVSRLYNMGVRVSALLDELDMNIDKEAQAHATPR